MKMKLVSEEETPCPHARSKGHEVTQHKDDHLQTKERVDKKDQPLEP